MALCGERWTVTDGEHRAVAAEVGGALLSYELAGVPITGTYPADQLPPKCTGAVLVPWPNRIAGGRYDFDATTQQLAITEPEAGNAIHGLGRWDRWTPTRRDASAVTLALDVVPTKGYPFEVRAEVTYAVHAETGLTVTLAAQNTGTTRAPFGAGSHPYLATYGSALDEVELTLPAAEAYDVDDRQIPTARRPVSGDDDFRGGRAIGSVRLDAGFAALTTDDGRGEAWVRAAGGSTRLWFDEAFGYLQVFTLDALTPGQPGVAIEPMTCAANAFNSGDGLLVLEPGESWSASWGIQPRGGR